MGAPWGSLDVNFVSGLTEWVPLRRSDYTSHAGCTARSCRTVRG
jgi:hypothetical protein